MSVLDQKLTMSVRSLMTFLFVIVVLPGTFLVGKYVFPAGASVWCAQEESIEQVVQPVVEEVKAVVPVVKSTGAVTAPKESKTEVSVENKTEVKKEVVNSSGPVITSYNNIELKFARTPLCEWKGTYGKITTIYYKLTNNEAGIVKPSKFKVTVEGYEKDDGRPTKSLPVPSADQELAVGETAEHGFDLGWAYSPTQTDITTIELAIDLVDEKDATMATVRKEFNFEKEQCQP